MRFYSLNMMYGAAVCLITALFTPAGLAGVVLDGTRVIYPADKRDITVKVTNMGKRPVLIQSWLDSGEEDSTPDKIVTPFMLTPPINRVEVSKAQSLRISATRTESLPKDRESVFWLNVLEIPAKPGKAEASQNYLQLAVRTRIKLFYRPEALSIGVTQAPASLTWSITGKELTVKNPTPFHISLVDVTVNGKRTDIDMVSPMNSRTFSVPGVTSGSTIKVAWIDDYGARREQNFTVS